MISIVNKTSFCLIISVWILAACQSMQVHVRPVVDLQQANAVRANKDFYTLGKFYLKSSDLGLAIDSFLQDRRMHGESVRALNGLGVVYDMLGRYDLSQNYYNKALDINPVSPVTFTNLAYSQYMQGEYKTAIALAKRAGELSASLQKDEDEAEVRKTILRNLIEAGEKKIEEDKKNEQDTPVIYQVHRVGKRNWEVIKERQKQAVGRSVRYKSHLMLQQILDHTKIKHSRRRKTYEDVPSESGSCRILNGTGRPQMARQIALFLRTEGSLGCRVANADSYDHVSSLIQFLPGYDEQARQIARALPITVKLIEETGLETHIVFTLGADLTLFNTSLSSRGKES